MPPAAVRAMRAGASSAMVAAERLATTTSNRSSAGRVDVDGGDPAGAEPGRGDRENAATGADVQDGGRARLVDDPLQQGEQHPGGRMAAAAEARTRVDGDGEPPAGHRRLPPPGGN